MIQSNVRQKNITTPGLAIKLALAIKALIAVRPGQNEWNNCRGQRTKVRAWVSE